MLTTVENDSIGNLRTSKKPDRSGVLNRTEKTFGITLVSQHKTCIQDHELGTKFQHDQIECCSKFQARVFMHKELSSVVAKIGLYAC